MGVQLNIKSNEAYTAAAALAELTGESLTTAVSRAISERLERERAARDVEKRINELRVITADIRRHLGEPLPPMNHDWMYDDETGLPK